MKTNLCRTLGCYGAGTCGGTTRIIGAIPGPPTSQPSASPSTPSGYPTQMPSSQPICRPSAQPSLEPIASPSQQPSQQVGSIYRSINQSISILMKCVFLQNMKLYNLNLNYLFSQEVNQRYNQSSFRHRNPRYSLVACLQPPLVILHKGLQANPHVDQVCSHLSRLVLLID